MERPETAREFSYRLIIGQYSTETKVAELNRVLDKSEAQTKRIAELEATIRSMRSAWAGAHPCPYERHPRLGGPCDICKRTDEVFRAKEGEK
jgi:hypothetical protein